MIILESCVTCGDKNYTADQLKKGIWHVTIIAFVFCASVWSLSMAVPQVYAHLFRQQEQLVHAGGAKK